MNVLAHVFMCVCVCVYTHVSVCVRVRVYVCVCMRVRGTESPNKAGIIGAGHSPLHPHQTPEHALVKWYTCQCWFWCSELVNISQCKEIHPHQTSEHALVKLYRGTLVLVQCTSEYLSMQRKKSIHTKRRSTHWYPARRTNTLVLVNTSQRKKEIHPHQTPGHALCWIH